MIEEIIRLKAEDYDILIKLEEARKSIQPLEEKHNKLIARIKELESKNPTPSSEKRIATDIDDETRLKEQRIIEQRLQRR